MQASGSTNDLASQVAALEDVPVFRLGFHVVDWEAYAGQGLTQKGEWRDWAKSANADWKPAATPMAPVAGMAPLLRRRADAADRLALEVAFRLAPEGGLPTVFASRHGQVTRSAAMLAAQALGEPASPMDFSLSVHNATAGQYAIAAGDRHGGTSLASRDESFASGLLEAIGLLAEGHERVLLVMSDPMLPALYPETDRREPAGYGIGLLLGKSGGEAFTMALGTAPAPGEDTGPQGLEFLRLLAGGGASAAWMRGGRKWTWARA